MLTLKQVNNHIQKTYPDIELVKSLNYFYLAGTSETAIHQLNKLQSASIYVYSLNDLSLEQWHHAVEDIADKAGIRRIQTFAEFLKWDILHIDNIAAEFCNDILGGAMHNIESNNGELQIETIDGTIMIQKDGAVFIEGIVTFKPQSFIDFWKMQNIVFEQSFQIV
jgi:hypothetical protein